MNPLILSNELLATVVNCFAYTVTVSATSLKDLILSKFI